MIKITPADKWFSLCVRERANWRCERCGGYFQPPTLDLHCAHYEGRGNWAVRFDPLNALALCKRCHTLVDRGGRRLDLEEVYIKIFGKADRIKLLEHYLDMGRGKLFRRTKGVGAIAVHYREEYLRMKMERAMGNTKRIEFIEWDYTK